MNHILVSTDFSPLADAAIRPAADLARRLGARLTLAHVVTSERPPKPDPNAPYFRVAQQLWEADEALEAQVRASLEERAAPLRGSDLPVEVGVARGGAVDGLLALVTEVGADLLVISSQGRSGLSRILLGSVAEELARRATVPVLIWKDARPA